MKTQTAVLFGVLVATGGHARAGVLVECGYVGNEPQAEFQSHPDCAEIVSGSPIITPEHMQKIQFNAEGLATLFVSGQYYYVKKNGALLPVIEHDNGADSFSEGLTRSRLEGRIAFFDTNFNQVIPPKYDWAWPFEAGRALVCLGCISEQPDSDHHIAISGGKWGFINRAGAEVVPVRYSKEEVQRQP